MIAAIILAILAIAFVSAMLWLCTAHNPPTNCDLCGTKLETHGDGGLQLSAGLVLDCPSCYPENFSRGFINEWRRRQ